MDAQHDCNWRGWISSWKNISSLINFEQLLDIKWSVDKVENVDGQVST